MKKKILCLLLAAAMITSIAGCNKDSGNQSSSSSKPQGNNTTSSATPSQNTSKDNVSSDTPSSQPPVNSNVSSNTSSGTTSYPVGTPPTNPPKYTVIDYKHSANIDMDDNVFMDSLVYTGYNIEKHRADGLMWIYVLASQKRGKGWLSQLGYAGKAMGYETNALGKPDIDYFIEKGGLVCATYANYVYFNYLPNVAGIDTSFLAKPTPRYYKAEDWRKAALDWVAKGYSKTIGFTVSKTSAGFLDFHPDSEIPIGSILLFCDARNKGDVGSHVCIYAGHKNNNHWVYHVGNENGPEFCSVERMHFGPDPQWPIYVITPPLNIRFAACLDLTLTDQNGNGIGGVTFKAKKLNTGKEYTVGTTDASGRLSLEGMPFGDYTLTHTPLAGYTSTQSSIAITLKSANNGFNPFEILDNKN